MKTFTRLFLCAFSIAVTACGSATTPSSSSTNSGNTESSNDAASLSVDSRKKPTPAPPTPISGLTATVLPDPNALSDIEADIAAATTSIDVGMYLFDNDDLANALVAAKARGVDVKVVIDNSSNTAPYNKWDVGLLTAGNIPVTYATGFSYYHAKYAIFDGAYALVMTCNWSLASFTDNREVIVNVTDAPTVQALTTIFNADFAAETPTLPDSGSLVVSPVNSSDALTAVIATATSDLWIGIEELDETAFETQLIDLAKSGVTVNVILPTEAAMSSNKSSAAKMEAGGVNVRALATLYPHEKVIVSDTLAYVGSVNLSSTSLTKNRETGVVGDGDFRTAMLDELQADWPNATSY